MPADDRLTACEQHGGLHHGSAAATRKHKPAGRKPAWIGRFLWEQAEVEIVNGCVGEALFHPPLEVLALESVDDLVGLHENLVAAAIREAVAVDHHCPWSARDLDDEDLLAVDLQQLVIARHR